jgi:hypothetical protein
MARKEENSSMTWVACSLTNLLTAGKSAGWAIMDGPFRIQNIHNRIPPLI